MKNIRYSSAFKRFVRSLDSQTKKRFEQKILDLAAEKVRGFRLHPPLQEYWKLRVGDYRILFQYDEEGIYVAFAEHRSKVYKKIR